MQSRLSMLSSCRQVVFGRGVASAASLYGSSIVYMRVFHEISKQMSWKPLAL